MSRGKEREKEQSDKERKKKLKSYTTIIYKLESKLAC